MAGGTTLLTMVMVMFTVMVIVTGVSSLHYEAPSDCQWYVVNGTGSQVSLFCRLRTINSQFDQTNFSVIPREHTVALAIECSDSLLYQSFLHGHSFGHLHHLRQLSIDYCKLGQLSRGVLHGLRDLRWLAIRSHNDVWPAMNLELSDDAFIHDVPLLERLDLSRNNIFNFREQIFCDLSSLQVLNVSHNRLANLSDLGLRYGAAKTAAGAGADFCPMPLTELDISHNHLLEVDDSSFKSLNHLRVLRLDHNQIASIDSDALRPLEQLERLDLSVNKLSLLPELVFEPSRSLRRLDLSNNSLSTLAAQLFSTMSHLEVLVLSWNELTLSEAAIGGLFSHLVRLVVLDLSHNRIGRIWSPLFSELYSVQVLSLQDNVIESIESGAVSSLSNLHTLQLSRNRLTFVDSVYFNGLSVLSQLRLDWNVIIGMDSDAFKNCSNLQELYLNGNRLERIPASFKTLTLLKTLDLSHNRIRFLNASSMRSLKNLVHLGLAGNQIKSIRQASFPPLPMLKSLDVSSTSLQTVERAALDVLTSLEVLHLNANNLTTLKNVLHNLPNLRRLNVSDNELRWFDYSFLPASVTWLDMHKNQIEELGNHLQLEAHLKLEMLDASYNRIKAIGGASLPHSVRTLSLSDNLISVIDPNTFLEKSNLSRVDLYGNQLVTLNLNALRLSPDVDVLPEFYLGGNPFQCDCDMEWLQHINALNNAGQYPRAMDLDSIYCRLSYGRGSRSVTPLVEASSSDFLCPYRTHCFALCHCCDFDACDCEMTCPPNCSCYHDQSWSTNVVDCSANQVSSVPSRIPMDATDVYLDGNQLPELGNHAFIGKKNLKTLLLNSSLVQSLHNQTFSGLKRLLILHLDGNELTAFHGYELEPLENLRELYLQHNRIRSIHPKTFSHLKNLQVLHLNHNALVDYAVVELSANPYLRLLSLTNNPWSCHCDFVRQFQAAFVSNRTQLDGAVTCSPLGHTLIGPSGSVNNETWADPANPACTRGSITLSQQHGEWLILITTTFSAALLLLTVGVGLCCFRRSLRALILSQCGLRVCTGRPDPHDDEKLFDALVIYSAKDDLLLKETLSKLEEKTYQLCLQHRTEDHDLAAAACASRRILVLLTKSFVETEWGKVHMRTLLRSTWTQPLTSSQRRQRNKLVVLLPEPQLMAEIDADLDLHLLMKHASVIQWNGSFRWSRLLLALPPARGVLAPADCPTGTGTRTAGPESGTLAAASCNQTHVMLQTTPVVTYHCDYDGSTQQQQQHHPFTARHHHKLIHQRQLPTLPETLPETI